VSTRRLRAAISAVSVIAGGCATPPASSPGTPSAPTGATPPVATTAPARPAGGPPVAATPLAPLPGIAPPPDRPSLGLFTAIRAPDGQDPVVQLAAKGAQVFRCELREGGGYAWTFRQPDAELLDARGQVIGRHGVNYSFEHVDGSRLVGRILSFDKAPKDGALPWLLIATDNFGDGQFKGVDYVQRINTVGGMPPPHCQASQDQQILRVDFTADFVFYRAH